MLDVRNSLQKSLGATYRVDRELATGAGIANGRVFLVHDASAGLDVVVKVISPKASRGINHQRFGREVRKLKRLLHPNVTPVLSSGIVLQLPYYTIPYVPGDTARIRLTDRGALPIPEALATLGDVARALEFAHRQGITHGALGLEHIILGAAGAVVTELGVHASLALARGQSASEDAVDDIHAFGRLAYELLTDRPAAGERAPIDAQRPGVPTRLTRLIAECLDAERDKHPTAGEIVFRLGAIAPKDAA